MRTYSDRIQVERGEDWTYDVYFVNRDDSPYIVSSQMVNPYIVVTIASSKYEQGDRYVANFWCPYEGKTFYCTQPIVLTGDTMPTPANGLSDEAKEQITSLSLTYGTYALYAWTDSSGVTHYKTWNDSSNAYDSEEYTFRFVIQFPTDITTKWIEQSYAFGIKLLGGEKNTDAQTSDDRPLVNYSGMQVLVAPMRLVVTSNIDGSMPLL